MYTRPARPRGIYTLAMILDLSTRRQSSPSDSRLGTHQMQAHSANNHSGYYNSPPVRPTSGPTGSQHSRRIHAPSSSAYTHPSGLTPDRQVQRHTLASPARHTPPCAERTTPSQSLPPRGLYHQDTLPAP